MLPFELHPFAPDSAPPISLIGHIDLQSRLLQAEFRLTGDISTIVIPPCAAEPQRRHELWKQTCFELFFGSPDTGSYHEVNLSPSGHWNLYRFDAYRKAMREEIGEFMMSEFLEIASTLRVRMKIDLAGLALDRQALGIGPCAVLLSREGILSYWALAHPEHRPDFHDPRWHFIL